MLPNLENKLPYDGELAVYKQFYDQNQADRLLTCLTEQLAWQEERIFIFGRWCKIPRLMCWYGDAEAIYKYSAVLHQPLAWLPELQAIRIQMQQVCKCSFNSVLGNLYRDGQDSMGCHADNEPELGNNPMIASLSFGAERLFRLHHNQTKQKVDVLLEHGDLLVMSGTMQHHWKHALPKTKKVKMPRVNLTFRQINSV
jgi:alkylated DNA repair dioxygenase AlkB